MNSTLLSFVDIYLIYEKIGWSGRNKIRKTD